MRSATVFIIELSAPGASPFHVGEIARYRVDWGGAGVNLSAGEIAIGVEPPAFRLVVRAQTAPWVAQFFEAQDVFTKQADANVIDTVDRIYALLPELRQWVPAGLEISVLSDRTQTIRASVRDMQLTLAATVVLVMLVVFLFLRRAAPTAAAGVTVPLALSGTCAAM